MVRIENERAKNVLDLQVSTVGELPAIGSVIGKKTVGAGSVAQVIQAGSFYTLDESGTWYDENGDAAS